MAENQNSLMRTPRSIGSYHTCRLVLLKPGVTMYYVVTLMYKGQQLFSMSDELLKEIDRKFGDMDKRTIQSLKIRTIQQGDRLADEHVQEFEKAALEAGYEGYSLVVEFKYSLNAGLRRRLMELWPMPVTIEQWYNEAITMDHQWKIAKTEETFYSKVNRTVRKPPQYGQQGQEQEQGQGQASSSSQGNQQQFFRNQVPPQHGQRQNTGQLQYDPNAMDIDKNQARRPPLKCFKCNGLGHMARDCQRQLDVRVLQRNEGCCKGPQRTHEEEGFCRCGSVKVFLLKLQNKFEGLEIDDSDTDIIDTGCTTPMNGASLTGRGAAKACLIPRQKNYIVTICYVKRFISKLKEHIS